MPTTRQEPTRTFKLIVAYDGTAYGGWQRQPHTVTIQATIEDVLAKLAGHAVRLHGSGRTDAGVHARAQVASCAFATALTVGRLRQALNANLPVDIRVQRVRQMPDLFHARFSAKSKEYRYQIDTGLVADPFKRGYAWHHPQSMDLRAMRAAARWLRGRHDFRALSANPMRPVDQPVRTLTKLSLTQQGHMLTIAVAAEGFLYKMVRSIVGALVKVGEGKLTLPELQALVKAKRRSARIETAPAHGLCLWQVRY